MTPEAGRSYLTRQSDPETAPRMAAVIAAIREHLADGEEYPYREVLAVGLAAAEVKRGTVASTIDMAVRCGMIERYGKYDHRTRRDGRVLWLGDWPSDDV